MATLAANGYATMQDVMQQLHPDGSLVRDAVDFLSKEIPEFSDVPWFESNRATGHSISVETGAISTPTWMSLSGYAGTTKHSEATFEEACGWMADYSKVPVAVAELSGDVAGYRMKENRKKQRAFAHEFCRALFYENAITNPDRIHGLAPRFTGVAGTLTVDQVVKVGTISQPNIHSIWAIDWGPDSVYGVYRKGTRGGFQHEDRGQITETNTTGASREVLVDYYRMDCGIVVEDYRRMGRLMWDSDDAAVATTAKNLYLGVGQLLDTLLSPSSNVILYADKVSMAMLRAQVAANALDSFKTISWGGRSLPSLYDVPLQRTGTLVAETA
jgi:hypothetical protein